MKMSMDYIAGFFDGEACFTISIYGDEKALEAGRFPFRINPRITVSVSREPSNNVLERVKEFLGLGKVYYHTRSRRSKIGGIINEVTFRIHKVDDLKRFLNLMKNKVIVKSINVIHLRKLLILVRILEKTSSK